jgi:hypothetical protein
MRIVTRDGTEFWLQRLRDERGAFFALYCGLESIGTMRLGAETVEFMLYKAVREDQLRQIVATLRSLN